MSGKPWIYGKFSCNSLELTTLRGGPSSVSGNFNCRNNQLTSLEGAPSSIGGLFAGEINKITSLHDIHKIINLMNGGIYLANNPITSCVLGVLLIKGCGYLQLDNFQVQQIINKYLPNHRGFSAVIDCQSELLDAGYDEYAKL